MKALFLSLSLLFSVQAFAAPLQLVPRWAIEKNAEITGVGNAERLYGLSVLCPLGESMKVKTEVGGWIARQADRRSMLYASVAWGYRAQLPIGGFFVEAFVGPAWVSGLDAHQSSHVQIKHDLGVGWTDPRGFGLGLGYSHMSNGGWVPPNLGRDFLGLNFLIPLGH